jgi:hypothetical protein
MTSPNPLNPLAPRPHDALPGHNPGTGAGTLHPATLRPAPGAEPATDRVPQVVRASRPGALPAYAQAVGDFSAAPLAHGGDALDLRELLRDQPKGIGRDPGALARHLAIDTTSSPGSTLLRLSRAGAFEPEGRTAQEEERLVLAGVDLRAAMGFGPATSDAQVIAELLARGKLLA